MIQSLKRYAPIAAIIVPVTGLGGAGAWWLMNNLGKDIELTPPEIQVVELVRPPPPPPKVEEPPPPPEIEEEVDLPEPEPAPDLNDAPDEPPPGEQLGLDAEGVAGSDGFGLVGNKGGRGLVGSSGGSAYQFYANRLKSELLSALAEVEELRRQGYKIDISLWVGSDGLIERARLDGSTGNRSLDVRLEQMLSSANSVVGRPPDGMPQPVRFQLVSRL